MTTPISIQVRRTKFDPEVSEKSSLKQRGGFPYLQDGESGHDGVSFSLKMLVGSSASNRENEGWKDMGTLLAWGRCPAWCTIHFRCSTDESRV